MLLEADLDGDLGCAHISLRGSYLLADLDGDLAELKSNQVLALFNKMVRKMSEVALLTTRFNP